MNSVPRSCRPKSAKAAVLPRRSATSEPVGRVRSSPTHGSQPSKTWCSRPVPRVSVRNSVRKPTRPRAGHALLHAHPAVAVVDHLLHAALAQCEELGDDADVVLGQVDRHALERLVQRPVDVAREHLRLADGQLEALAAHELDEHRELQLAAALDLPGVGPLGVLHAQGHVADELLLQTRLDLPRGELAAVLAGERRGVDADRHRQRRLVDRDDRERPRVLEVGERLADRHVRDAGDGDDLPRPGLLRADAVEGLGDEELRELGPRDAAVGAAPGDVLAAADRPVAHAADRQAAQVGRRVEVRDVGLQRVALLVGGRGDVLDEQVHERLEVGALHALREGRPAGPRVRVDDRELDLALVGVEVEEQLVDLVDDLGDARVGPVDLVDDEHDRQPRLQRLAQDEARLGQRALRRVDEQQHAVDHRQPALDLAAEVRVPGRVDDVELHVAVGHGGVLREDRDALLALEVHRVHDTLVDVLVLAEGA